MMEQRPHLTYALYDLRRWRVLILIPLTRLVFNLLRGVSPTWHRYELVAAVILVTYAIAKQRVCRYQLSTSPEGRFPALRVHQGIVWRRCLRVAAEDAASVEIERTPLLGLLGGRRVRINTAGLRRRADAQLYLSAAQTSRLFSLRAAVGDYHAHRLPVLLMSLSGSNAAVGLLTVSPVLRQVGTWLGTDITQDVTGWLHKPLSDALPPTLRLLANALVIGWSVSVLRNFLRYVGFRARREENHLHLVSGWFTRRDVLIDCEKITALELRQTLFMRLLSLYTAVITAAGYGRDIGTRPVLVPAAHARELSMCLDRLLGDYPIGVSRLRPARGAWWRYTAPPFITLLLGCVFWWFGRWWQTVALLWCFFSLWWLFVRYLGWRQAGFGCSNGAVSVSYPRGLALYRVEIPVEVVDCLMITQSWLQKRQGACTVRIRCYGEKKRVYRVWQLPYDAVYREWIRR